MKPRLAVLDMVGTTVKSGREVPDAFREAFQRVGVSLTEPAVSAVRGKSKAEAIADLVAVYLPDVGDRVGVTEEIYADFRRRLRELFETQARPLPGATAAFTELRRLGLHVVLTTGLDRDTATGLIRGLGWERLGLSGVVTGDDVRRGRPAPDLIHAAMALVSESDAASVLVVGDTVSDLEAAARAEVGWSVGVLTGAHTRDHLESVPHSAILESVAQLPGYIANSK